MNIKMENIGSIWKKLPLKMEDHKFPFLKNGLFQLDPASLLAITANFEDM